VPTHSVSDIWELFAVRFASIGDRRVHDNFIVRDMHDGPMPLDFYFWFARNRHRTVLIDTGFAQSSAQKRGRALEYAPHELLRKVGIAPESIEDIVLTHLHYDHAGGLANFPNARYHVQDKEVAFATGRSMCHVHLRSAFDVHDVHAVMSCLYEDRLVFHNGDEQLFEGLSLHLLPGHSNGLQGVRVQTKRGAVLLASDASHYYANFLENRPYVLSVNLPETLDTYRRLHALVDRPDQIVPGHDPRLRMIYPHSEINGVQLFLLHEQPAWPPPPPHGQA
jgi:glyoxylase-like metal-dependent hydrolase (beta-lactamase superfamily II)